MVAFARRIATMASITSSKVFSICKSRSLACGYSSTIIELAFSKFEPLSSWKRNSEINGIKGLSSLIASLNMLPSSFTLPLSALLSSMPQSQNSSQRNL